MAGILLEGPTTPTNNGQDHARALAAEQREASLQRAAKVKARVGDKKLTRALSIDGRVLCDQIVDAGARWSRKIMSGNHLRIIDLEGQQAVDFLCYDLANTEVRYNAGNTLKFNGSIFIGKGVKLYSIRQRA
jgi:uncharacterized protein YcgI (DUF1989 family)